MGMRATPWAVGICLLALAVAAPASAQPTVGLYLDGQPLRTDPPAFIEDGTTMAPVRAVVQALGGGVQWTGNAVHITSHPKTFMATAVAGEAGPAGPIAPTIALTQYLAGIEQQSLQGVGPVLVRFDILDVRFDDVMVTQLQGYQPRGYTYAVRLFYEDVAPLAGQPRTAQELTVTRTPTAISGGGTGPTPGAAWYDEATIDVVPSGAPSYRQSGDTQTLVHGQDGWHADPQSLSITKVVDLPAPAEVVHGAVPH